MAAFSYSQEHEAFTKSCTKCATTYIGHKKQEEAERVLSFHFASDKYTIDGFYGLCRTCVSKSNQAKRGGRICDPEAMLKEQDGKCAICNSEISLARQAYTRTKALVDHNHKTNKVRGLLCQRCNTRLGMVEEQAWLDKALAYLAKYRDKHEDN